MPIEFDGLEQITADFDAAGAKAAGLAPTVVAVNAGKIKAAWREGDSGLEHAPAYPASITYDVTTGTGYAEAEIGPDKARTQGALGNLLEYGSAHNAPRGTGARALAANTDDLERAAARMLEDIL